MACKTSGKCLEEFSRREPLLVHPNKGAHMWPPPNYRARLEGASYHHSCNVYTKFNPEYVDAMLPRTSTVAVPKGMEVPG